MLRFSLGNNSKYRLQRSQIGVPYLLSLLWVVSVETRAPNCSSNGEYDDTLPFWREAIILVVVIRSHDGHEKHVFPYNRVPLLRNLFIRTNSRRYYNIVSYPYPISHITLLICDEYYYCVMPSDKVQQWASPSSGCMLMVNLTSSDWLRGIL